MCKCCEKGNCDTFLGGFLLGALIGVAAVALSTPNSGKEARKELSEHYDCVLDKTKVSLKELRIVSKEKIGKIVQLLKEKVSLIAGKLDNLTNQGAGVLIEDEII